MEIIVHKTIRGDAAIETTVKVSIQRRPLMSHGRFARPVGPMRTSFVPTTPLLALVVLGALGCQTQAAAAPEPVKAPEIAQASLTNVVPTFVPSTTELADGVAVPDLPFTLQDGFKLSLPALKGKPITVYFCASSNDPDCMREAQGLRTHWEELHEQHHAVIIGVSPQDTTSLRAFIAQQNLPFDLASDVDRTLARAFGVPASGHYAPRTFLVGKDGKIRAHWQTTDPEAHVKAILAASAD